RTTFTYMVRYYLPFDYVHLLRHRQLVFGTDIVLEIAAPDRRACVAYLLGQIPNLVGFAQSRGFHCEPSFNPASLLERGLSLRLLLEDDVIAPLPEIFLREAERRYPNEMRMLHVLRSDAVSFDHPEMFATFKMLAEKIHARLEAAAP